MTFLLFNSETTLKPSTGIYCLHTACSNEKSNPSDLHFKGLPFALGFKYYAWKMDIYMTIHEACIKAGKHRSCKSHCRGRDGQTTIYSGGESSWVHR